MNPLIQPKNASPLILIALLLACLALSPRARAVVPAPDGGYPGQNTAEGQSALLHLAGGTYNTALGWASLGLNVTGNYNTGVGAATLLNNTASENTATGAGALLSNTSGAFNTANGAFALFSNITGNQNTGAGVRALYHNTTGNTNTANGFLALFDNTTGFGNTANGVGALQNNIGGDNNTGLGQGAGTSIDGSGNVCIGQGVHGEAGVDDRTYIRNVNTLTQSFSAGVNDYVTVRLTDGRLGHTAVVSSRRYKEAIKPLDKASEALYGLMPVSFRLKKEFDPMQALGFGLIAEEVEKVDPALVYRNAKGQVESVRYEMVNAMLLNEFLKEHRKNEEQEAKIARQQKDFQATASRQQKEIEALTATVKEQAAQILKVSDQLELSRPAPQTVLNNH